MASNKVKYEVELDGAREARDDLDKLGRQFKDTGEEAKGGGDKLDSFATRVTAVAVAVPAVIDGLKGAFSALKEFSDQLETTTGIFNRFTGNIDDARSRTNGLVTDLNLMKAQMQLINADVQITNEQFGSLSVAAIELGAAVGKDATESVNELTQVITEGSAEALRRYGVNIQGVTDKSEIQRIALEQLNEQYGDAESSADTLAGQLGVMENKVSNATDEMMRMLGQNERLAQLFNELGEAINTVFGVGGGGPDIFTLMTQSAMGFIGAFTKGITILVSQLGRVREIMDALISGDFNRVFNLAGKLAQEALRAPGAMVEAFEASGLGGPGQKGKDLSFVQDPGGGSGGGGGGSGDTESDFRLFEPADPGRAFLTAGLSASTAFGSGGGIASSVAATSQAGDAVLAEKGGERGPASATNLLNERIKGQSELNELLEEQNRVLEEGESLFGAVGTAAGLLGSAIQQAVSAEQDFGEALLETLEKWLQATAIQEGIEAIVAFAQAAFAAATQNYKAAAEFAVSGGLHLAAAAAAGGGAAVVGAISGGGGADAGSAASADRTTPEADGAANDNGRRGPTTVVYNINGPIYDTKANAGRMIERLDRARERKYG